MFNASLRSTSQSRGRVYLLSSFGVLILIWTLWSMGVRLNWSTANMLTADHMDHLGSAPTEGKEVVVGPIPVAVYTPPQFLPFASFNGHKPDSDFVTERPLILYAFFETELARKNLIFFLQHGLHNAADFLFIFNGDTDAEMLLPDMGNVRYVKRKNDCYDLGAFAMVLTTNDLYKKYTKYIMLNASIRGPFIPYWSADCWSERYLSKLTPDVKLVGMSMNCMPRVHIQSMIWATDRIGMEILLFPSDSLVLKYTEILGDRDYPPAPRMQHAGINSCPHGYLDAVAIEVYATGLLQAAGYQVDPMMLSYHTSPTYEAECGGNNDPQQPGKYYGMDFHPYDTIFIKSNRNINPFVLDRFTGWTDLWNYTSYEACNIK